MSMEHTPSPWEWGIDSYAPEAEDEKRKACGGTPLWGANGKAVLVIYESHGGGQMPEGIDRTLIEAAPDLLAALIGVVKVADRQTVEFDAARAAIRKAIAPGKDGV